MNKKKHMKHVKLFEQFINESFLNESIGINEAMQVSDNLKSVKTPTDLVNAVGNDFLIIHSKHEIGEESKRGGQWPNMWIIRGLKSDRIKVDSFGHIHLSDLKKFAIDHTGYSKKWNIQEIFNFFNFNKKRGNIIYTVHELPIHKEAKRINDEWNSNQKRIMDLLGKRVDSPGNRSVMTSTYAVMGEGQSHGVRYLEFDGDGKGRTYFWNVYSYDPSIRNERSVAKFGYSKNESLYRIDKKAGNEILKLAESQVELAKQARSLMTNYYKTEKIQPK